MSAGYNFDLFFIHRAGDALAIIASISSMQDPFITVAGRVVGPHRYFAGSRHSDHIAMLNAFYSWDEAR